MTAYQPYPDLRLDDDCDDEEKEGRLFDRVAKRLYDARTVIISGGIDMKMAKKVVAELLALGMDSDEDITLYLNSPGGHVEAGDTIHDIIRFISPRVRLVGTGWVASAGAHIFLAAPVEDRYCLPNTRFLLHQPSGGADGWAKDIDIEAQQILKMRERLNRIISEGTGQPLEKVKKDTDRNFWLTAEEALDYGLCGKIISSMKDLDQ
jgi:ATP-dependent Clp protease protease subunit